MDRATLFAKAVVAGKKADGRTRFGELERLACQRHLKDLRRQGTKGFPYIYSEERAARRIAFSEELTIAKGKSREQLNLREFQAFIRASEYGWVHKDTGFRRFRTSYKEFARQSGKSLDNSENSVYYANFDGYAFPEIYCAATKEDQAKIVLKAAMRFIEADEDLKENFKIQEYKSLITAMLTGGEIKAVGRDSKTLDGIQPYYMSVDEYHAHKNNQMYKLGQDGAIELDESLISVITTAGFNLNSPCKELHDYCVNVLYGTITDETQFVYITAMDSGDDYWDEKNWQKANPLWSNKRLVNLRASAVKAKHMGGAELRNFLTKALNMWYAADENEYMNKARFAACASSTSIEDMAGKQCVLGLDLSSGGDLTSGALEFELDIKGHKKVFIATHSFMPASRLQEHIQTDLAPYDVWAQQGLITATKAAGGWKTDYKAVLAYYRDLRDRLGIVIKAIGYDPHNAAAFLADLEEFGCPLIEVTQSCKSLNDATCDFKLLADAGDLIYDKKDEVFIYSVHNAITVSNSFGEIKIDKNLTEKRIDPVDAAIIAHKVALTFEGESFDVNKFVTDEMLSKLFGGQ